MSANDIILQKHFYAFASRVADKFIELDGVFSIDGNIVSCGSLKFSLTGFANNLSIHNNTFYAASDTNHSTPLASVSKLGDDVTFTVHALDALAHPVPQIGDVVSVSQSAGSPVNLTFFLTAYYFDRDTSFPAEWEDNGGGTYSYWTEGYENAFVLASPNSYSYVEKHFPYQLFQVNVGKEGLLNYNTGIMSDDVRIDFTFDDSTGLVSSATVTLKEGAFPVSFDNDTTIVLTWLKEQGDGDDYDDVNIVTAVRLDDDFPSSRFSQTLPVRFVEVEQGSYLFSAPEITPGFIQNASTVTYKKAVGGDSFTLSGLRSGLTLLPSATVNLYNICFFDKLVGTVDMTSYEAKVTINEKEAFPLDAVSHPVVSSITLSDNDPSHDRYLFKLYLDDKLTDPRANGEAASFLQDTVYFADTRAKYTYTPATFGWSFGNRKETKIDGAVNRISSSYTFNAGGIPDPAITPFSIIGLRDGLTNLKIDTTVTDGSITADDTQIATFHSKGKQIDLTADALPVNISDGYCIDLLSDIYSLYVVGTGIVPTLYSPIVSLSISGVNGSYSASVSSSGNYYVRHDNLKKITYRTSRSGATFAISGLRDDLGALSYSQPNFTTSGNLTVAYFDDLTLFLTADALPANPDSNSTVQFTANTGGFSLALADDVAKRDFSNESFTPLGNGSYLYSASGSTVGWYIDNGVVRYDPTDLNGSSHTFSGLRHDLGHLAFDDSGRILSDNCGVVGFRSGNSVTWYQHALLTASAPVNIS